MTSSSGGEAIAAALSRTASTPCSACPARRSTACSDGFHQAQLKVIGARHEQACGYMAFGYARSSGRPGVFSVVPGPGVLNASAALLTALGCNEPVLCLTGQVPTQFLGKGRGHLHEMPDQLATLRTLSNGPTASNIPIMRRRWSAARSRKCCRAGAVRWRWKCRGMCSRSARMSARQKPFDPFPAPQPDPDRIKAAAAQSPAARRQ
jgi:acetolactate synthase-1/2/3 large subunit